MLIRDFATDISLELLRLCVDDYGWNDSCMKTTMIVMAGTLRALSSLRSTSVTAAHSGAAHSSQFLAKLPCGLRCIHTCTKKAYANAFQIPFLVRLGGFSQTFVTIVKVMGPEAFRPNRCLVEDSYGKPILAAVFVFYDPYGKKSGVGKTSVKTLSAVKTILKYLLQQGADPKGTCSRGHGHSVPEYDYPLDRNGSRPIRAAHATTSPHVQKWSLEAILFIKSSLVANKTFCESEL